MSASTKILVKWMQGRSKGTTSWLKHANVKDGLIVVGEQVKVVWGKSKKLHDAIVKDDGTVPPSVQAPTSVTKRNQAEIELDLVSPASSLPVEDNEFHSPLTVCSRCSFSDAPASTRWRLRTYREVTRFCVRSECKDFRKAGFSGEGFARKVRLSGEETIGTPRSHKPNNGTTTFWTGVTYIWTLSNTIYLSLLCFFSIARVKTTVATCKSIACPTTFCIPL